MDTYPSPDMMGIFLVALSSWIHEVFKQNPHSHAATSTQSQGYVHR
jgi:hypothetical protein